MSEIIEKPKIVVHIHIENVREEDIEVVFLNANPIEKRFKNKNISED